MIDYLALTIGHGLLAFALWHLVLRDGLDADPLLENLKADEQANRKRKVAHGETGEDRTQPRSSSASGSADNQPRSSSVSGSAD